MGDKAFKLFFTAHELSTNTVDKEWESTVEEAGDRYATVIIERPLRWKVTGKVLPAAIRSARYYVTDTTPIFVLEQVLCSWQAESSDIQLELTAGMAVSDLLVIAEELEWSFYFSKEFLEASVTSANRVIIWGAQQDFEPKWQPSPDNSRRSWRPNLTVDTIAKRSGCLWSNDEEENLLGMYSSEKYKIHEIAEYHQRTISAMGSRLQKLGCFKEGRMTEEELLLMENCERTKGDLEGLARRLQRSPSHCQWFLSKYGQRNN